MVETNRTQYNPDEVSPPGETLREMLEERGMSHTDLGTRMGRPKKTISEIMNGKAAITPETALQLELVLGVPASFWTEREAFYRQYVARKEQESRLAAAQEWTRRFPVRQLQERGLIRPAKAPAERVRSLLEFFGVASPSQWDEHYHATAVAFRTSARFKADTGPLATWLRAGVLQGERIRTAPYDRARFIECLRQARGLTTEQPEVFQPKLQALCAEAGVAVAFVPEFKGSRASGATRWLGTSKALIQLSLRYRSDDHLWFTFFHEAAHILLHKKKEIFIEGGQHVGAMEEEANRWAADFLIPPGDLESLTTRRITKASVLAFSREMGIAPGIVVGRLQHDGLLPHTHLNGLKRRFLWATP